MMLAVTIAAFALAAGGLLLIVRGATGPLPALETVVAELHRPRHAGTGSTTWNDRVVAALAGRPLRRRQADLAVTERSAARFVQDRCTWALLGAAPGMALVALSTTGVITVVSPLAAVAAIATGAAAGWLYAISDLRGDAVKRRREFRHTLATYLELVTILMAGGAGVETALYDGASVGRGPAFRQVRSALSAAQARREAPWTTLGVLGERLGVVELQQLEASMSLAGGGARIRESLVAKAESMRVKDLGQLEAEAETRSETMVLPTAMMFAGFLLLIGYPALAGLSGA